MRFRQLAITWMGVMTLATTTNAQPVSFSCTRIAGGGCTSQVEAYAEASSYDMYYNWESDTDYPPIAFHSSSVISHAVNSASAFVTDGSAGASASADASTLTGVGISTFGPALSASFSGTASASTTPSSYAEAASWVGGTSVANANYKVDPDPNGTQTPTTLDGVITFDTYGSPPVGDAGVGYFSMSAWYNGSVVYITGDDGNVRISGELPQAGGGIQLIDEMQSSIHLNKSYDFSSGAYVGYEFELGVETDVLTGIPYAIHAACSPSTENISGLIFSLASHISVAVD